MTDDIAIAEDHGLSEVERRFVLAYVGEARGVATHAARIAGFAASLQDSWSLLQRPRVRAAIDAIYRGREMDAIALAHEIHDTLLSIMRSGEKDADRIRAATTLARLRGISGAPEQSEDVATDDPRELIAAHERAIEDLRRLVDVIDVGADDG